MKNLFLLVMVVGLLMTACNETPKESEEVQQDTTAAIAPTNDIVKKNLTSADGSQLEMTFDNAAGTATIVFKGDTATLTSEKPASGIWYKNDNYELSGKGEDVELKKSGKVIFKTN